VGSLNLKKTNGITKPAVRRVAGALFYTLISFYICSTVMKFRGIKNGKNLSVSFISKPEFLGVP